MIGGLYGFERVNPSIYMKKQVHFRSLLLQRHRSLYSIPLQKAILRSVLYELLVHFQLKTMNCAKKLSEKILKRRWRTLLLTENWHKKLKFRMFYGVNLTRSRG